MKILALSHSCVSDVNQQLFVALSRLPDVRVELIVPANWVSDITGLPQKPRLLPNVAFPVHALPVAMPGHVSLHFYPRLPLKRLRQFAPDIVLSSQEPWSLSHAQAGRLARRLGVPVTFQTNQNIEKRYLPPFRQMERRAYREAALAMAYSEEARQVLLRKGLRVPSAVVPYGTDLTQFRPGRAEPLRRELGLNGSVVVGYLGRLVPEKGLDTLIGAVARLTRQDPAPDLKVLIVGAGSEEAALRGLVARAGLTPCFVFAGTVPHAEAGEYLRAMDVFVLPSRTTPAWKEQFGRVIVEALACEVPVVGSDSGQIPHLLRETGGGLVFAEGDDAELAERLGALCRDAARRRELGRTGGRAIRARYGFEAVAAQMHGLFRDTLDRRNSHE